MLATITSSVASSVAGTTSTVSTTISSSVSSTVTVSGISINFESTGVVTVIFLICVLIVKELLSTEQNRKSFREVVRIADVFCSSLLPVFAIIVMIKILMVI